MNQLVLLVLSVSAMAFTTSACQFGSESIQSVYDRFELFRTTKAFDPADSKIPLEQYSYSEIDGEKRLAVKINDAYMVEYSSFDGDKKIQTKNGQYQAKGGVILSYKRDDIGQLSFDDWSNGKKFESSQRSIDAELPSDFEEDYKKVLVALNAERTKMFDFQKGLSKEDSERVRLYDFSPFSAGGFYVHESDGGSLTVSKQNGSDALSGRYSCENKDQKYNIVDGKVVVDEEPFVPVYQ